MDALLCGLICLVHLFYRGVRQENRYLLPQLEGIHKLFLGVGLVNLFRAKKQKKSTYVR
jgi:hypothetical protein